MYFFYIQVDPSQAHSHTIISDMGYQQCTHKCRVRWATFRRNVADKPGSTLGPPVAQEQPGIVKLVPKQNPWPEQLHISKTFKPKSQTKLRGMRAVQKIRLILMRHQIASSGSNFRTFLAFLDFFFFFVSALTQWEVLSGHLQLVLHLAPQHPSQINQSAPPLFTANGANYSANGGIKADGTVQFCCFSSHLSSSQPVINSLSSPSPPPH